MKVTYSQLTEMQAKELARLKSLIKTTNVVKAIKATKVTLDITDFIRESVSIDEAKEYSFQKALNLREYKGESFDYINRGSALEIFFRSITKNDLTLVEDISHASGGDILLKINNKPTWCEIKTIFNTKSSTYKKAKPTIIIGYHGLRFYEKKEMIPYIKKSLSVNFSKGGKDLIELIGNHKNIELIKRFDSILRK